MSILEKITESVVALQPHGNPDYNRGFFHAQNAVLMNMKHLHENGDFTPPFLIADVSQVRVMGLSIEQIRALSIFYTQKTGKLASEITEGKA